MHFNLFYQIQFLRVDQKEYFALIKLTNKCVIVIVVLRCSQHRVVGFLRSVKAYFLHRFYFSHIT